MVRGLRSCSFWVLEHRINSCGACAPHITAELLHSTYNPWCDVSSESSGLCRRRRMKQMRESESITNVCLQIQGHKEKAMAPHSSPLAWKIPCTEEPGGLQFMELQESETT